MSPTQLFRPTVSEASEEAFKSPDTHWTANLSSGGMTRIARSVVLGLGVPPVVCWCDSDTYEVPCEVH